MEKQVPMGEHAFDLEVEFFDTETSGLSHVLKTSASRKYISSPYYVSCYGNTKAMREKSCFQAESNPGCCR